MKKASIIFSIDDGRYDLYSVAKEFLIPNKIPATLNISTTRWATMQVPLIEKEKLLEIGVYPFLEIANHSDLHTNEPEDIYKGFTNICDMFGYDKTVPMGFASPFSHMTVEYAREHIEELRELGIKYVRTSNQEAFNKEDDVYALTSYAVTNDMSVEHLKEKADEAVEQGYCLIYLLHSITKEGDPHHGATWSYDFDKFVELANYIRELEACGKAELMTTMEYVDRKLSK